MLPCLFENRLVCGFYLRYRVGANELFLLGGTSYMFISTHLFITEILELL